VRLLLATFIAGAWEPCSPAAFHRIGLKPGAWAGAFAAIATIVWAVRAFQKEAADKTGSVSWRWTRNLGGCSLSLVE
jgi:hypothetical protein